MSKVLLVDTNRAAVPIYFSLVEKEHEVFVIGEDASAPLAKLSKNYIQKNYSDISVLTDVIQQERFDYLIPGCTDQSYQAVAKVREHVQCHIDSPEQFATLNEKHLFRSFAESLNIPVPRTISRDALRMYEKVLIKPVDSFSGRGISILQHPTDEAIDAAWKRAEVFSPQGEVIAEEFVEGQLWSYSAFIVDKKVAVDFVVREDCIANAFAVDCSYCVFDFPPELRIELQSCIEKIAGSLGLKDGLVHTQFIWNGGRYWLIEVTRRCPGDLYSLLIEYSTGYPYAACYAGCFLGEQPLPSEVGSERRRIIRHTITSSEEASLLGLRFRVPVKIHQYFPLATMGDRMQAAPRGRVGILFLEAADDRELADIYSLLQNKQLYSFNEL